MIDFDKYDIKVKYFSIYAATLHPETGEPLLIMKNDVWFDSSETDGVKRNKNWKKAPKKVEKWCEKHRGETLIIYRLSPCEITYAVA
jgi:hypothetical protein